MKKKLSLLLAVLMLTVLLAGCVGSAEPTDPEPRDRLPITEEEAQMLAQAYWDDLYYSFVGRYEGYSSPYPGYREEMMDEYVIANSADDLSVRLMGHFGDVYVYFCDGAYTFPEVRSSWDDDYGEIPEEYQVPLPTFQQLLVYSNGRLCTVSEAYLGPEPLLTDENMAELKTNLEEFLVYPEPPELEERVLTPEEEELLWRFIINRSYYLDQDYGEIDLELVLFGHYGDYYFVGHLFTNILPSHMGGITKFGEHYCICGPYTIHMVYVGEHANEEGYYIYPDGDYAGDAIDALANGELTNEDLLDCVNYVSWYLNGLFDEELHLDWWYRSDLW